MSKPKHLPRGSGRWRALFVIGLLSFALSTHCGPFDEDKPTRIEFAKPPKIAQFGKTLRWIAWMEHKVGAPMPRCPEPTGEVNQWDYGRLFPPNKWFSHTPDHLVGQGVFCRYDWVGDPPREPTEFENIRQRLPEHSDLRYDEFDGERSPDPPIVVPVGINEDAVDQINAVYHSAALHQLGAVSALPPFEQGAVMVAVLDSVRDRADHEGLPGEGRFLHGRDVGLLIRNLACPENHSGCRVRLSNHYVLDQEPDRRGHSRFADWRDDRVGPGYYGTPGGLADGLWKALDTWRSTWVTSRTNLVINISVAWETDLSEEVLRESVMSVRAVWAALAFARCEGALVVAAAGNDRGGLVRATGPMGPAAWEQEPVPTCVSGSVLDAPLVFSVGGIDALERPLANTRDEGRPALAAYALHVAVDDTYLDPTPSAPQAPSFSTGALTGTSMSAAAASAAAALVWSYKPAWSAEQVYATLLDSGLALAGAPTADYCRQQPPCNQAIKRLSLCEALKVALIEELEETGQNIACPPPVANNPSWPMGIFPLATSNYDPNTDHWRSLSAQQPTEIQECGSGFYLQTEQNAQPSANPCPSVQLHNQQVAPQLAFQPDKSPCPACQIGPSGATRRGPMPAPELASDDYTLVMGLELPGTGQGTLTDVHLRLRREDGKVTSVPIEGQFTHGQLVVVEGIAVPQSPVVTAEVVGIVRGHTDHRLFVSSQISQGVWLTP